MAKGEKHNNVSSGLQNTRINKQHIFSFIGGGNKFCKELKNNS
jgi:hypothetical protein